MAAQFESAIGSVKTELNILQEQIFKPRSGTQSGWKSIAANTFQTRAAAAKVGRVISQFLAQPLSPNERVDLEAASALCETLADSKQIHVYQGKNFSAIQRVWYGLWNRMSGGDKCVEKVEYESAQNGIKFLNKLRTDQKFFNKIMRKITGFGGAAGQVLKIVGSAAGGVVRGAGRLASFVATFLPGGETVKSAAATVGNAALKGGEMALSAGVTVAPHVANAIALGFGVTKKVGGVALGVIWPTIPEGHEAIVKDAVAKFDGHVFDSTDVSGDEISFVQGMGRP